MEEFRQVAAAVVVFGGMFAMLLVVIAMAFTEFIVKHGDSRTE